MKTAQGIVLRRMPGRAFAHQGPVAHPAGRLRVRSDWCFRGSRSHRPV